MINLVHVEISGNVALITLNRPEKRNALSPAMVSGLMTVLDGLEKNTEIKAVILTGEGKAFCAGADLAYLKEMSKFSDSENLEDSQKLADLFYRIFNMAKLTIAMINGPALAGGCGLALCCDYRFADEGKAIFGFTEVRIGFIPAIVMNFLIRRVAPITVQHLAISGDIIPPAAALQKGIVHELFPTSALKQQTFDFVDKLLSQNSFQAMMDTKKLLFSLDQLPLQEGIKQSVQANAHSRKTADCQKGLRAFLAKEPIDWGKGR